MHWLVRGLVCLCATALGATGAAGAPPQASGPADPHPQRPPSTAPAGLTDDPTIWPNRACFRSSEPWLVENHTRIRKMKPRVLVLNFANDVDMASIQEKTEKFIRALAESTRYHGFKNPQAPAFIEYEVAKYVDLRDDPIPPDRAKKTSSRFPVRSDRPRDMGCDYDAFFGDEFAKLYGFLDPRRPGRHLNLQELIEAGTVHELWFYCIHEYEIGWPAFEVTELKQYYDERGRPIHGEYGPAGNGGDKNTFPWVGRSFRIYFFNPHRGPGCQLENFGHLLEGYANHNAIAAHTRYFKEYADLDWDTRYGLPFSSLYAMPYDRPDGVSYPNDHTMKIRHHGKEYTIDPYIAVGGNNHWAPGARHHYDLRSPHTVKTVIENYRLRNGPDGQDQVTDFNIEMTRRYRDLAPDCQGQWMVFWCQCMPGLDNRCVDDRGETMKNWWVYLFY